MIISCYDPLFVSGERLAVVVTLVVTGACFGALAYWARSNGREATASFGAAATFLTAASVLYVFVQPFFGEPDEPRDLPSTTAPAARDTARAPEGEGSSATATLTPSPSVSEQPTTPTPPERPSYQLEYEDVPFAIRPPGSCDGYTAVDFDGDPFGDGPPITRRVVDPRELTSSEREAIDMYYETCADAVLSAAQGASVGLLRKAETGDVEGTAEQCAAAAKTASIGGELNIEKNSNARDTGFEVGASLCAVTPQGRVAKATITHITYGSWGHALVEFTLTTWRHAS